MVLLHAQLVNLAQDTKRFKTFRLPIVDLWRLIIYYAMFERGLILNVEGSPSDDEFVQDAAKRPHVSLVVVSLASEDLRTAVR